RSTRAAWWSATLGSLRTPSCASGPVTRGRSTSGSTARTAWCSRRFTPIASESNRPIRTGPGLSRPEPAAPCSALFISHLDPCCGLSWSVLRPFQGDQMEVVEGCPGPDAAAGMDREESQRDGEPGYDRPGLFRLDHRFLGTLDRAPGPAIRRR